jgi:hypothetical protein
MFYMIKRAMVEDLIGMMDGAVMGTEDIQVGPQHSEQNLIEICTDFMLDGSMKSPPDDFEAV